MIKVFIADDHEIVREGMKSLLARCGDMAVVGEAGTGRETVRGCLEHNPEVLILDLDMPGLSGLDIIRQIRTSCPNTGILVLTMHDSEEYAMRAMRGGARGYLLKASRAGELPEAIRKVSRGEMYVAASIIEKVAYSSFVDRNQDPLTALSGRELQVLKRLATGKTLRETAEELGLSLNTVGSYKRRIKDKMCFKNNEDMLAFSRNHGLV